MLLILLLNFSAVHFYHEMRVRYRLLMSSSVMKTPSLWRVISTYKMRMPPG